MNPCAGNVVCAVVVRSAVGDLGPVEPALSCVSSQNGFVDDRPQRHSRAHRPATRPGRRAPSRPARRTRSPPARCGTAAPRGPRRGRPRSRPTARRIRHGRNATVRCRSRPMPSPRGSATTARRRTSRSCDAAPRADRARRAPARRPGPDGARAGRRARPGAEHRRSGLPRAGGARAGWWGAAGRAPSSRHRLPRARPMRRAALADAADGYLRRAGQLGFDRAAARADARPGLSRSLHCLERMFDAELNPEQRAAVTHGDGPLLIVAGAGTGQDHHARRAGRPPARPGRPRRAPPAAHLHPAGGPRDAPAGRATLSGHPDAERVWGGTFHAVGNRLLRLHGRALGLSPDFTVLDQGDAAEVIGLAPRGARVRHQRAPLPAQGDDRRDLLADGERRHAARRGRRRATSRGAPTTSTTSGRS